MIQFDDFQKATYPPFGRCIYCSSTESLEDEHIIPFGLGSSAYLPNSSCRKCAKLTCAFEQRVLRGNLWRLRAFREIKSRTKHKDIANTFPLTITKLGKKEVVQLLLEEYPHLVSFPIFSPPGILAPLEYTNGIGVEAMPTYSFGKSPEEVQASLEADSIDVPQTVWPIGFARMIGKIAYCYAVAEGFIPPEMVPAPIVSSILGNSDDIGKWVGNVPVSGLDLYEERYLHKMSLHVVGGYSACLVRLFSDSGCPPYCVILAKKQE